MFRAASYISRVSAIFAFLGSVAASSATVSDKDHFETLAAHAPTGSSIAITLRPQEILKTYKILQTKVPGLPSAADILAEYATETGVDLTKAERVSFAGSLNGAILADTPPETTCTLVVDFNDGTNLETFAKALPEIFVKEKGSKAGQYLVELPGGEDDPVATIAFTSNGSLVMTNAGGSYAKKESHSLTKLRKVARTSDNHFILSFAMPPTIYEFLSEGIPDFEKPENTVVTADFDTGAKLHFAMQFAGDRGAAIFDDFFTETIDRMIDATVNKTEEIAPEAGALLMAENSREGNVAHVEMRLPQPMLRVFVGSFANGFEGALAESSGGSKLSTAASLSRSLRNAQNLASVSASASAAGAELDASATTEEAIRTMVKGVNGGGSFADTRFYVPNLRESDIAAAAAHLSVDKNSGRLDYSPSEEAMAQTEYEERSRRSGSRNNSASYNKRNAQNLVSVCSSAYAAGADLEQFSTGEEVIDALVKGINGGGSFSTTRFQVPRLTKSDIEGASKYMKYDRESHTLDYVPSGNGTLSQVESNEL